MLKILGVSRSGYRSFLNRKVSPTRQRKNAVKKEIQKIYDNSKQNYGAPKIAQELIKVLKRNAYGYRDFNRFRNRILHMFLLKSVKNNTKQAAV